MFLSATHLIKPGKKFGGIGGSNFDDSKSSSLTFSHYLSGIRVLNDSSNFDACQFIYTSFNDNQSRIFSSVHGSYEQKVNLPNEYHLDDGERIVKVQVRIENTLFYTDTSQSSTYSTKLIKGLKFTTNKGRSFPPVTLQGDNIETEENFGFILGYVAGKAGRYIDQLQFYWYRA